jgi:triosephosphate isomerase
MKKVVIANWKQNMTMTEVKKWLTDFGGMLEGFSGNVTVVICPSHPHLSIVSDFAKDYDWISVGSQDISAHEKGTYTGEVGALQVKDFADFCIVGHSERGEETSVVAQKIELAFTAGLTPIICFVNPERLNDLKRDNAILLWEDSGNISHDGVFTPKPVEEIRSGVLEINEKYDIKEGLIYGGSINRQNVADLGNITELDGGIVGGASLDPQHFFEIVKSFSI